MNYTEAREYLDNVSASGIILGLDSIRALMEELENPQDDLRIVHIAGTNGKGSILSYTKNILMDAGYRVGCYSSPSVFGYLERFQIDGEWMAESEFPELVQKVKDAADRMTAKGLNHPTVFELETAIAFEYFKERNCDYVMLETGMGGDLDSTNVIKCPLVCAFASISMDHIGILGSTLREIATCKSGIIKPDAAVVTGPQDSEAMEVLAAAAESMGCRITHTEDCIRKEHSPEGQTFLYKGREYFIKLLGRHQLRNAAVAIEVASALQKTGAAVTEENIRNGLAETRWPGRLEIIRKDSKIWILDGAHNAAAAECLAETLRECWPDTKFTAVTGVFRDKEYSKIAAILSDVLNHAICIDLPDGSRSLPKEELAAVYEKVGVKSDVSDSIETAIKEATSDAVLVTGSLSLLRSAKDGIEKYYF